MENIAGSSSPGVRAYIDPEPHVRIAQVQKMQNRNEFEFAKKGLAKKSAGPEEKISSRIDRVADCDSVALVTRSSSSGPDSLLTPRLFRGSDLHSVADDNDVSRSQVISSQSFPISMSRVDKK